MKKRHMIMLALMAVLLCACAAGVNSMKDVEDEEGDIAGFWVGIWHGLISPIVLIVSLFNKNINIYEIHNTGFTYNWGFLIGMAIIYGGPASAYQSYRNYNA